MSSTVHAQPSLPDAHPLVVAERELATAKVNLDDATDEFIISRSQWQYRLEAYAKARSVVENLREEYEA